MIVELMPLLEIVSLLLLGAFIGAIAVWLKLNRANQKLEKNQLLKENELNIINERLTNRDDQIVELKSQIENYENDKQSLNQDIVILKENLARIETQRQEVEKAANEKLEEIKSLRENLKETFQALSAESLKSNNKSFLEMANIILEKYKESAKEEFDHKRKDIDKIIQPIKDSLGKFDDKIGQLEKIRVSAYSGLTEQVKTLIQSESKLHKETANLAAALRNPKVRGNWGELHLKQTVEMAGMVKHCEFVTQETNISEEGRAQRPDMIINLPNGRTIVIDAKTPMDAYLRSIESNNEESRSLHLNAHSKQIKDRMRDLGLKKYWEQFEISPEFVVLFLPNEALFSAALELDSELINFGVKNKVILATPTTLIALLLTVAYGWQQDTLTQNARQISELGKELHIRVSHFATNLTSLGKNLEKAVDSYNTAIRNTENKILSTTRKLKELGSYTEKEIPLLSPIEKTTIIEKGSDEENSA